MIFEIIVNVTRALCRRENVAGTALVPPGFYASSYILHESSFVLLYKTTDNAAFKVLLFYH